MQKTLKQTVVDRLNEIADTLYKLEGVPYDVGSSAAKIKDVIDIIRDGMFSVDQLNVSLTMKDIAQQPEPKEVKLKEDDLGPAILDTETPVRILNCLKQDLNYAIEYGKDERYSGNYAMSEVVKRYGLTKFTDLRIGHFRYVREPQLFRMRNFGKRSFFELKGILERYGVKLGSGL